MAVSLCALCDSRSTEVSITVSREENYTTTVLYSRHLASLPAVLVFLSLAPVCSDEPVGVWVGGPDVYMACLPTAASTMCDCVNTNTTLPLSSSSLLNPQSKRRQHGGPVSGYLFFLYHGVFYL